MNHLHPNTWARALYLSLVAVTLASHSHGASVGSGGSDLFGGQIANLNQQSGWTPNSWTQTYGNQSNVPYSGYGQTGMPSGNFGRPGMGGGHHGGHRGPRMTAEQKQVFESCLQQQGITLPTPGQGTPPQMPSETQRQAMQSCHQQAMATGQSATAGTSTLSDTQQQAFASCVQQQGLSGLMNCRAQILGSGE